MLYDIYFKGKKIQVTDNLELGQDLYQISCSEVTNNMVLFNCRHLVRVYLTILFILSL